MSSFIDIKQKISDRVGSDVLDDVLRFVATKKPSLWGINKPPAFVHELTGLTIYKDMTGTGYQKILSEISFLKTLNSKSFCHNAQVIRPYLQHWALQQIILGTEKDWENEKQLMEEDPSLKEVNLWIDSSDFPKIKYKGMSRKAPDWSYKCNRPGLRFTTIESASRQIRKMWGGYSPKTHDGEFLRMKKRYFEKRLAKAVIIGDQHYSVGEKLFERLKFRTPIRKPGGGRPKKDTNEPKVTKALSPKQKKYNAQQRHLRSRVESPFGWIKDTFECLSKPWQEDDEQLEAVVYFSAGCFNNQVKNVDYKCIV